MKPILFNTDMVKAIMEGRKTVTRRLVKAKYRPEEMAWIVVTEAHSGKFVRCEYLDEYERETRDMPQPFYTGDTLYVRETWAEMPYGYVYRADDGEPEGWDNTDHWRPSIHMPKAAARIFLRVTDVRVEPLQDISAQGAQREGIAHVFDHLSEDEYQKLRDATGTNKRREDWPWNNYLWHGDVGSGGTGNRKTDAWPYQYAGYDDPIGSFSSLWNLLTPLKDWGTCGWDANPWVWVIEFERCERVV